MASYHFNAKMVPTDRTNEVEVRAKAWDNDTRAFVNRRIESAFNELRGAVEAFYDVSLTLLWFGSETHYEWLEMRSRSGDEHYEEDVDAIVDARNRLVQALQEMYKVAQSEHVTIA